MHKEETTISEELMTPSWKGWIQENKLFLITIGCLTLFSFGLMIQNYKASFILPETSIPLPSPIPSPKHSAPKRLKRLTFTTKDPFQKAKELFQESKCEEAIQLLLHLAKNKDITVRKKASVLAKEYRLIQLKREETKKTFLQGYVLFQTYPQKACEQWKEALTSQDQEDPYFQKAQKQFTENCLIQ